MDSNRPDQKDTPLHGSLLRLGPGRQVAIYWRDGLAWVAELHGQAVEVSTVGAWFSRGNDRWAMRRAVQSAVTPLPKDLSLRIEALHRGREKKHRPLALGELLASFSRRAAGKTSPA